MDNSNSPLTLNIEEATLGNANYRKVLFTGKLQLVLMSLKPGEEIGVEVHETRDQFFRVEQGQMKAVINDKDYLVNKNEVLIVPAGSKHNIINNGSTELKLYTIYAPSEHPAGTVQVIKP